MAAWYHGSPLVLDVLATGSTITQDKELARIFSHKPAVVSWEDDGRLRHTGTLPGCLYAIDEVVAATDVLPHPRSTMPPGAEWLTQRPLRLRLLTNTIVQPDEYLSANELAALAARMAARDADSPSA